MKNKRQFQTGFLVKNDQLWLTSYCKVSFDHTNLKFEEGPHIKGVIERLHEIASNWTPDYPANCSLSQL